MATLLIVTGASRGLGRAMSVAFAASTDISSLHLLLIARSEDGLAETASLVTGAAEKSGTYLDISHCVGDLSDLDSLEDLMDSLFGSVSPPDQYNRAILINNAGSLGYLGRCADALSLKELRDAVDFNVTSSVWISSRFVKQFSGSSESRCSCVVINVSSLCAIEPFPTMAIYCSGKAARDMFHRVLAKEEEEGSLVKVLNYAPGMCETEMSVELAECKQLDKNLGTMYKKSLDQKTMVQPKDTAEKLVQIVLKDEFQSGDHIDFWD